jgi:hypothetical protein
MKQNDKAVLVALATASTTVVLSMVLNSWAFTQAVNTWFGHTLGVLLPLWVLANVYMGHRMWPLDRRIGGASYALAGFALLVSMPHLAAGYATLGLAWWECWSLALVTDLTQVVSKLLVIAVANQTAPAAQVRVAPLTNAKRQRRAQAMTEPTAAA